MIECDEIRPQIAALLDRELTTTDADRVEAHLKGCEHCAKVFDEYRALRESAAVSPAPVPIDLWAGIGNAIDDTPSVDLAAEMRLMRQEMQALREEVAALRYELAKRPAEIVRRGTSLTLSDAPGRYSKPYQLV